MTNDDDTSPQTNQGQEGDLHDDEGLADESTFGNLGTGSSDTLQSHLSSDQDDDDNVKQGVSHPKDQSRNAFTQCTPRTCFGNARYPHR
jgi:hypothetical protein